MKLGESLGFGSMSESSSEGTGLPESLSGVAEVVDVVVIVVVGIVRVSSTVLVAVEVVRVSAMVTVCGWGSEIGG